MANRLLPWAALGCFSLLAGIAIIQFRYAVLQSDQGSAFLLDRWSGQICLVYYGGSKPDCKTATERKQAEIVSRLRDAGFSENEIQDWQNKQSK